MVLTPCIAITVSFGIVALDLLEKLLDFDPHRRITVEQALEHPYLHTYHDPEDEPTHEQFDFSFEQYNRMEELKRLIMEEINTYYNPNRSHLKRQTSRHVLTDSSTLGQATQNKVAEQPYVDGYVSSYLVALFSFSHPRFSGAMDVDQELENELAGGAVPTS